MSRGAGGVAELLFSIVLRLFPRWFLEGYREEMLASFRAGLVDAKRTGRARAVRFVIESSARVVPEAVRIRRESPAVDARRRTARSAALTDDLRHAASSLSRAPTWTGAALLILTIGIAGTTATFSLVNAVLLDPLPFHEPEELVSLWTVNTRQDIRDGSSWENATDWLERGSSLGDIALVFRPEFTSSTVTSFGRPERLHVGWVSPTFFGLLGVEAVAGRVFDERDLASDARLVVIDEALWDQRYARDPGAVGETLTIDGEEYRVVGVVPDALTIPLRETSIWRLQDVRTAEGRDWRGFDGYWVIGRLAEGVDVASARADLGRVASELAEEYPETNRNRGVRVTPLRAEIVGDDLPVLLWTLFGSAVLVLLVGAANVAQLMLSRGLARTRELAVRAALGATRARVNRQLFLEGVLLGGVAALGAVLLVSLTLDGLLALVPPDVPLAEGARIDLRVLGVAVLVTGVLGPLVGLLPTLTGSRARIGAILRSGGRGATSSMRGARATLVVGEVAMAVVLLGAAGLLLRSAAELRSVDPGFDARATLLARIDLSPVEEGASYAPVRQELMARLGGLPGVAGVGAISQFFVERFPDQTITLVGEPPRPEGEPSPRLTTDAVSPGFFEALGVPLLRGREFEVADIGEANFPTRALVNRAWVETFSPDADPVGRQFRWGDQVEGDAMTVVGVVGDLSRTTLAEVSYPQMFVPAADQGFVLAVRHGADHDEVAAAVRATVGLVDPGATVSDATTAWDRYTLGLAPRRFLTLLVEWFAGLGTVLAAIGLFAILHETVVTQRREIGIRVALGAAPESVRAHILGRGLGLTATGLVLGLALLSLLSGLTGRLVFGVRSTDPVTFAAVTGGVLIVATLAAALPARSATSISPVEALAEE